MDTAGIQPLLLLPIALLRLSLSATAEETRATMSAAIGKGFDRRHKQETIASLSKHRHGVVGAWHADGADSGRLINPARDFAARSNASLQSAKELNMVGIGWHLYDH